MPQFKTTKNIFKIKNEDEVFEDFWMNNNTVYTPPTKKWDYSRELQIEDVSIWEVFIENGGGFGVYAAWEPYAEFYMITPGVNQIGKDIETFYGRFAQKNLLKRLNEYGVKIPINKIWVENEDMWLYV